MRDKHLRVVMQRDRMSSDFNAEILMNIRHQNIVKVYSVSADEHEIILMEEHVKGRTLAELCKQHSEKGLRHMEKRLGHMEKRSIGRRKIKLILRQICHAVRYLHKMEPKQIIHGDIKPDNIMVSTGGRVKLIDFSASQIIGEKEQQGRIRRYGTPYFSAPEVYRGETGSAAQDIYGIGATLLYMLRGEESLWSDDIEKRLLCDATGEDLPFLRVAYRCLREEPHLRYQSVEELLRDIK